MQTLLLNILILYVITRNEKINTSGKKLRKKMRKHNIIIRLR
jgi:hypothetical protein